MNKKVSLKIENEEIVFADLTNRENLEAICVCKSRNIYLFDLEKDEKTLFSNLAFDTAPNSLNGDIVRFYSFENYICIVQNKGIDGVVIDLSNPNFQKNLKRGDYCVDHCTFPIAFYKKDNQTFLIHGTDWNRLDITCLETDELLTDRIVDYDTNSNYFDYFHSSLLMSPDGKSFTSNGWHWHPFGQIYCFSVEDFLQKFEISHKNIDLAEECYSFDWDRPLCWVDKNTLAIGFSKNTEDYGKSNFPNEILFVEINENKILHRIEFAGFANTIEGDVFGNLFYTAENKQFIGLNKKNGLMISDVEGNEIFRNSTFTNHKYSEKHKLIYQIDIKNQLINFEKLQI